MHRNRSKLTAVALVAAIALGVPALAKSAHSGRAKAVASLSTGGLKAERATAPNTHRSARRAPTFAAPNSTSPALSADGTAYNINFYVY